MVGLAMAPLSESAKQGAPDHDRSVHAGEFQTSLESETSLLNILVTC
jgi:hypothetical protein